MGGWKGERFKVVIQAQVDVAWTGAWGSEEMREASFLDDHSLGIVK